MIEELLDDPALRGRMGAEGLARVEEQLGWWHTAPRYAAAIEDLTGVAVPAAPPRPVSAPMPLELAA